MAVVFYRIDDRLVHGQVMTAWSKIFQSQHLIIIDDQTAKDAFLTNVMKMSVPHDYLLSIWTVEEAVEKIKTDPPDRKAMVLVKGPEAILRLLDAGVNIKELNVGNIGAGAGRRAVLRSIQLSPVEYDTLKVIASRGVRVYLQIFPDGKAIEFDKVKY